MDLDHVQPVAEDETIQNRDKFVQDGNMLLLEGPSHGHDGVNVEEEEKNKKIQNQGVDVMLQVSQLMKMMKLGR